MLAERFTGKNITLPILGNLLIETEENRLFITATNLEYAAHLSCAGKGTGKGKISVPAKILSTLIQSIKEDKMDLEGLQGNLVVSTESRRTKINGVPADDFPLLPKIKKQTGFKLDLSFLKGGLAKVLPAVATSEFKPELTGVLLHASGQELKLAATDTFRLAEQKMEISNLEGKEGARFILPRAVAQEMARIPTEGEARIILGDNQILIEADGIRIYSRLIDGSFPDYTGIIPKDFGAKSFVAHGDFTGAIRSASIFASKIQEVTLSFHEKDLEVLSQNPEIGEQKILLPASSTGEEIEVSFNYRYLLDGLGVLDEEEVFLGCNKENQPSLLRNKSDGSFFYILMPIRLT